MACTGTDPRTGNTVIRVYAGINPMTKKRHYVCATLPKDATDDQIAASISALEARAAVTKKQPHAMTIGSVVAYYVEILPDLKMSGTTIMSYRSYNKCHVQKRLSSVAFESADAATFDSFFGDLRKPKKYGGAELSDATIERVCSFLKGCFRTLKSKGIIKRNPMVEVKVPHQDSEEVKPLFDEDYRKLVVYLLDVLSSPVVTDDDFMRYVFAVMIWTVLHTGIRRGELSGLLTKHHVHIAGEASLQIFDVLKEATPDGKPGLSRDDPKTKKSKDTLTIDDDTDDVLLVYKEVRDAFLEQKGIKTNGDFPLFCRPDGRAFRPRYVTDTFRKLKEELDIDPGAHLHALRHTHISILIEQGASEKDIQERARHASSKTTLDIYGHLMPGRMREIAEMGARKTREIAMQRSSKGSESAVFVPTCPKDGNQCVRFAVEGSK